MKVFPSNRGDWMARTFATLETCLETMIYNKKGKVLFW